SVTPWACWSSPKASPRTSRNGSRSTRAAMRCRASAMPRRCRWTSSRPISRGRRRRCRTTGPPDAFHRRGAQTQSKQLLPPSPAPPPQDHTCERLGWPPPAPPALAPPAPPPADPALPAKPPPDIDVLQLQVSLDRLGFSPGVIDGRRGATLRLALSGFQQANGL